jgi:signal transduction histidine kinase
VEVAKAIGDMRAILERSLGAGIRLEFKLPTDLWAINVDLGQLEMVILNLVMNGRDAMPDGGILILEAANTRGADQRALVRICVRDTGIGMTTEVRARAFEPFFSTKEPGRGTGLGLSQAYGFANQSGGTMEIESEPGKGTAIALLLPALDSPDSASSSQH